MKQFDLDTLEVPVRGGDWMQIEFGRATLEVEHLQSYRVILTQLTNEAAAYFHRRLNRSSEEFLVRGTAYADGTEADWYGLPVVLDPNFTIPNPTVTLVSPPEPDIAKVHFPGE